MTTPEDNSKLFRYNLIANLFKKRIWLCKQEYPEVQTKRQILDHYLKDICKITSHHGIFTIEIASPKPNHKIHQLQTDDIDIEFSKVFKDYTKNIQHQNSQRANSIFTNKVFSIIYRYLSILELKEIQGDSPTQTSRHTAVRRERSFFSKFLNTIRENFTNNDVSQIVKHDVQKILVWFVIDYFVHNLDFISLARKNFQPQKSNNETILADETYYVWDPEWSHPSFFNIRTDISSQAITTVSINRAHVRITKLTIYVTHLNHNSIFTDRAGINSLNSVFISQDSLNGTRNLTQQDIQTPTHFVNREIVETMPTTTQQSISPIHPTLTTPKK